MARSHKDGRRRGGHIDTQNREIWSRRCPLVNMTPKGSNGHAPRGLGYKAITHRFERRQGLAIVREQEADLSFIWWHGEDVLPNIWDVDDEYAA